MNSTESASKVNVTYSSKVHAFLLVWYPAKTYNLNVITLVRPFPIRPCSFQLSSHTFNQKQTHSVSLENPPFGGGLDIKPTPHTHYPRVP